MFRQCEAIWLRPVGAVTFSNWKFLSVDSLSRHISVFRLINLSTLSLMLAWECRSARWCWWYFFGRDLLRYFVRSRVWLQSLPLTYIYNVSFFPYGNARVNSCQTLFRPFDTYSRSKYIFFCSLRILHEFRLADANSVPIYYVRREGNLHAAFQPSSHGSELLHENFLSLCVGG